MSGKILVINFDKVLFDDNWYLNEKFERFQKNELFPGMYNLLKKYRDLGYRLVVISNRQHKGPTHKMFEDVLLQSKIAELLEMWIINQAMRSEMLMSIPQELHVPEDTPLYLLDFWARDVVPGPTRILHIVNKHEGLQEDDIWEVLKLIRVSSSN